MPVGMPRPLSRTVADPPAFSATSMRSQCPANASSIALSTGAEHGVQSRPVAGVADIHARPLANRIDVLQDHHPHRCFEPMLPGIRGPLGALGRHGLAARPHPIITHTSKNVSGRQADPAIGRRKTSVHCCLLYTIQILNNSTVCLPSQGLMYPA